MWQISVRRVLSGVRGQISGCAGQECFRGAGRLRVQGQRFVYIPGAPGGDDTRDGAPGADNTRDGAPGVDDLRDGSPGGDDTRDGAGGAALADNAPTVPTQLPGFGGRMIRRRSLSPLDRVSQMVSPEFVSQEVKDLRNAPHEWKCPRDPHPLAPPSSQREACDVQPPAGEGGVPPDPQGEPFKPGDLIIAEFKRRHYTEFKNMAVLTESGKLLSNWGAVPHADIVGKLPGQRFRTSAGVEFLLRRPSLEEYILLMKRGPTISYPKDIAAMLLMMDVGSGDVVLEAGSGSGGMSLFLSRAVGPEGRVYSFEVRADHHKVAKKNFLRWRTAWECRGRRPWPDNVLFINKDVADASPELESVTFDAVALDMLNPQVALPTLLPHLKQGAVCAVYLANITQVIDLLEGIRSCRLPLVCEKISEVSLKDWLVAPSVRKDGSPSQRVDPECSVESQQPERVEDDESDGDGGAKPLQTEPNPAERVKPFGQVPYIARPMPWLPGHTAFLVQLRKFKPACKRSQAEDPS